MLDSSFLNRCSPFCLPALVKYFVYQIESLLVLNTYKILSTMYQSIHWDTRRLIKVFYFDVHLSALKKWLFIRRDAKATCCSDDDGDHHYRSWWQRGPDSSASTMWDYADHLYNLYNLQSSAGEEMIRDTSPNIATILKSLMPNALRT